MLIARRLCSQHFIDLICPHRRPDSTQSPFQREGQGHHSVMICSKSHSTHGLWMESQQVWGLRGTWSPASDRSAASQIWGCCPSLPLHFPCLPSSSLRVSTSQDAPGNLVSFSSLSPLDCHHTAVTLLPGQPICKVCSHQKVMTQGGDHWQPHEEVFLWSILPGPSGKG